MELKRFEFLDKLSGDILAEFTIEQQSNELESLVVIFKEYRKKSLVSTATKYPRDSYYETKYPRDSYYEYALVFTYKLMLTFCMDRGLSYFTCEVKEYG